MATSAAATTAYDPARRRDGDSDSDGYGNQYGTTRLILTMLLFLTLATAIAALVLHSYIKDKYPENKNNNYEPQAASFASTPEGQTTTTGSIPDPIYNGGFDNTLHSFGIAGACLGIIAAILGLMNGFCRLLHRRSLTLLWLVFDLLSLIVISFAVGEWVMYHRYARTSLPDTAHAALAVDAGLAFFLWLTTLIYVAKSMLEYALSHK